MTATNSGWRWPMLIATLLSGFAFIAVNVQVYTARWRFIDAQGDALQEPPTISKAITLTKIGEPFTLWITASAIALVIAVAVFMAYYMSLARFGSSLRLKLALFGLMPLIFVLQVASGWGMYTLSAYTLRNGHDLHMMGSYVFFGSEALVVLLYGVFNQMMLRAPELGEITSDKRLNKSWMRRRRSMAFFAFGMAVLYGVLFQVKSTYPYNEIPLIYTLYVSTEPLVITCFLFVVAMACVDKLRA